MQSWPFLPLLTQLAYAEGKWSLWRKDYHKLNKEIPTVIVYSDVDVFFICFVDFLLVQINIYFGTWYRNLIPGKSFLLPVSKDYLIYWQNQYCIFNVLPQCYISSLALHQNVIWLFLFSTRIHSYLVITKWQLPQVFWKSTCMTKNRK